LRNHARKIDVESIFLTGGAYAP